MSGPKFLALESKKARTKRLGFLNEVKIVGESEGHFREGA